MPQSERADRMNRSVLILGAGVYQTPLIKSAKSLGFSVCVASVRGNYPGFALADKVFHANTIDKETILSIAATEGVRGICTAGTDVCLPSIGYVCDHLGLTGPTYDASVAASNKLVMKEAFERGGVRSAPFRRLPLYPTKEEVGQAISELGLPCMFKVIDSSGSRGVKLVSKLSEVEEALSCIEVTTNNKEFLIEKFIGGKEFGAQALVADGRIRFTMVHDDMVKLAGSVVPIGHSIPFGDSILKAKVDEQVERTVASLGLDNCALNFDLIESNGEVYVIEVAARSGATCLPELVSISYQMNYYDQIVRLATDGPSALPPFIPASLQGASVGRLLTSDHNGVIKSSLATGEVTENGVTIHELALDYRPGESVRRFEVGPDRIGHVVMSGRSLEACNEAFERISESIIVE